MSCVYLVQLSNRRSAGMLMTATRSPEEGLALAEDTFQALMPAGSASAELALDQDDETGQLNIRVKTWVNGRVPAGLAEGAFVGILHKAWVPEVGDIVELVEDVCDHDFGYIGRGARGTIMRVGPAGYDVWMHQQHPPLDIYNNVLGVETIEGCHGGLARSHHIRHVEMNHAR